MRYRARRATHQQVIGGAWRVLPHVLLLQRPSGLDRVQVGRIVQAADTTLESHAFDRPAPHADRGGRGGCPITRTSPRCSCGSRCRVSHATKRSAFAVANIVCRTTQPVWRMAPSSVSVRPQFIGTRSMCKSVPRFTQVCVRYIATWTPDSSRNTESNESESDGRRSGMLVVVPGHRADPLPAAGTVFFDNVVMPMQRPLHARDMHPRPPASHAVVGGGEFVRRRITQRRDQPVHRRATERRGRTSGLGLRLDMPVASLSPPTTSRSPCPRRTTSRAWRNCLRQTHTR